jgi:hypothetical protein
MYCCKTHKKKPIKSEDKKTNTYHKGLFSLIYIKTKQNPPSNLQENIFLTIILVGENDMTEK